MEKYLDSAKKRAIATTICCMIIFLIGSGVAFATGEQNNDAQKLIMKTEAGAMTFSADDGTWQQDTPANAKITRIEDGPSTIIRGGSQASGQGVMVKNENGKVSYSTDGGKSWSNEPPVASTEKGNANIGAQDQGVLVKDENGVTSHSIDGGKTWVEGLPPGAEMQQSCDGGKTCVLGEPPTDAPSLSAKNEDGKMYFSIDGGKTWSEEVPEGVVVSDDGKRVEVHSSK